MQKNNSRDIQQSKLPQQFLMFVALIFVGYLISIFLRTPSHNRDWAEEFAIMPEMTIDGNLVKMHNMRDWLYSDTDVISKAYIDRTFDSTKITKVWFLIEPFSGWEGIAHTYITFDFSDQPPVSFSIEARREKTETFTAFGGLWNKFEVAYLWGTEQDFLLGRVVHQHNHVYMVPLKMDEKFQKTLFLSLAKSTQELAAQPRFYNTIDTNCTNVLADEVNKVVPGTLPWDISRIFPGYSGRYLTKHGYLDGVTDWDKERDKYLVNQYVNSENQAEITKVVRENILKNF